MARRFPSGSDALSQSNLRSDTLLPCRYKAGTSEDADKSIPFSLIQSTPIAVCSSSSGASSKVATVQNFPDFTLQNGSEIVVYFSDGNSATSPSLNINGTGAIPLDSGYWNAGSFIKVKYVDITVSGNRIQKYLVDAGAYNTTTQLNSSLANYQLGYQQVTYVAGTPLFIKISKGEVELLTRFGEQLFLHIQDEISAVRMFKGYDKFLNIYTDDNYFYIGVTTWAGNVYIKKSENSITTEVLSELPSGVTQLNNYYDIALENDLPKSISLTEGKAIYQLTDGVCVANITFDLQSSKSDWFTYGQLPKPLQNVVFNMTGIDGNNYTFYVLSSNGALQNSNAVPQIRLTGTVTYFV